MAEALDQPTPLLGILEGPRFLSELQAFFFLSPWLLTAPRGHGAPVLVIPGISASDVSTGMFRKYLSGRGHAVYGWRLGPNQGLKRFGGVATLVERVRQLRNEHGQRVSLIGFSLGGVQARRIAVAAPDLVQRVITVGSPIVPAARADNYLQTLPWRVYENVNGRIVDRQVLHNWVHEAAAIPTSHTIAIYSRSDGVVSPRLAGDFAGREKNATLEAIEVVSSHYGLLVNPAVYYAVADRLAQPAEHWRSFNCAGLAGSLYPQAATAAGTAVGF